VEVRIGMVGMGLLGLLARASPAGRAGQPVACDAVSASLLVADGAARSHPGERACMSVSLCGTSVQQPEGAARPGLKVGAIRMGWENGLGQV